MISKTRPVQHILGELTYEDNVETMLCDKLRVFSKRDIFRRIKDLRDIYTISKLKKFKMEDITTTYVYKHGQVAKEIFSLDLANVKELSHAYSNLKGIKLEIPFKEVYENVTCFTVPIFHSILTGTNNHLLWDNKSGVWYNEECEL